MMFVVFGTLFFLFGGVFCYFLVLPLGLKFLIGYGVDWYHMQVTIQLYFGFVVKLILAFAFAESVEGNGFIAAFVAGLGLTAGITSEHVRHQVQEFGETEGMQLILVVFLIFGLAMVPAAVPHWGVTELIYALLSLTVLRMVPVALSLLGAKLDWQTVAFIGWFEPRGIASVLYLLMAVAAIGIEGNERIMSVIVLTVMISVYAHGITATPLSKRYGASRPSLDK